MDIGRSTYFRSGSEFTRFYFFKIKLLLERCCRIAIGSAKKENKVSENRHYYVGEVNMSDVYKANQVGSMGPKAMARDNIFNQINLDIRSEHPERLLPELNKLRSAMKLEATTVEHDAAVGEIANAENAIKKGDAEAVGRHLRTAGSWALDIASKIGADVAAQAIKHTLGI